MLLIHCLLETSKVYEIIDLKVRGRAMYYRLGSIEQVKQGEHKVNIVRDFTLEEFETFSKHGRVLGFHLKNKHLYQLIVKNGEEFDSYLEYIKNKKQSELEKPDHIIFEANRLFMNYLSMLKTYDDHISFELSRIYGHSDKDKFKDFLSINYDEFFTYRFIVRLRNFAQRFNIPLASFTGNSKGNTVIMKKQNLLEYSGWSAVKKEIEKMDEDIPVNGMAKNMNSIMKGIYFFVMQRYCGDIIEATKWISSVQKEFSMKPTILAVANSKEEYESGKLTFTPMNSQMFIDSIHDINELPNVNIKIN
jgi:hypothetical protein